MKPGDSEGISPCPAPIRSRTIATSASWPTSMPARRRRPSASSITPARATRWARCMKAPRPWIGWSRSRSAASPSPRPRPPRSGTASASTSSTRPATSTSPSRWSVRCACSTAPSACSIPTRAWSRRPRRCGARATAIACRASSSATRWTRSAPIISSASRTSSTGWAPSRWPFSCRSAPRTNSRASSISCAWSAWCGTKRRSAPSITTSKFRPSSSTRPRNIARSSSRRRSSSTTTP